MLNNNIRVIYIIFLFAFCPFYISCNVKNLGEKDKFPKVVLQDSHSPVKVIAFSPDGKTLASGSSDNTIKLWDVDSDSAQSPKLHTLRGHLDTVVAVMFSPDGKTLISVGSDNVVKFWDVGTGEIIKPPPLKGSNASFPLEGSNASFATFSPDGKTLAVGNQNDGVDLWNIDTDEFNCTSVENHTFKDKGANAVAFSHDSKTLAISTSYSSHEVVEIWEVDTGKFIKGLEGHSGAIDIIAFSPDGRKLATASVDKTVTLWDVNSGKTIRSFKHPSLVNSIAFSPDSQILASGSLDKMVRLWDVTSGKLIKTLEHPASIYAITFSEKDKTLASVTSDNTVRLWHVANGNLVKIFSFEEHSSAVRIVAFSPDGETLASVTSDGVWLWDLSSGENKSPECIALEEYPGDVKAKGQFSDVMAIAFSPDSKTLASGSFDGKITLWQVEARGKISSWEGYPEESGLSSEVNILAFSSNGRTLISIGVGNVMKSWNVAADGMLGEQNLNDDKILALSTDGDFMIACGPEGDLELLNVTDGKTEKEYKIDLAAGIKNAVFSLDGRTLALCDSKSNMRLLDVSSGQFEKIHTGHFEDIIDIAFSPDGKTLAASAYNKVLLWDVSTGRLRKIIQGHFVEVNSITFSPDGKILASGSSDGTIKFWRITDGELVATSYVFRSGDYLTYCPQGYYFSSKNGDNFLSWQIKNEIYTLEQYSDVFKRPELVKTILSGEVASKPDIRLDKQLPPKLLWKRENRITTTVNKKYVIILKFEGLSPLDKYEFFHNGEEVPVKKAKETEIKVPLTLEKYENSFRVRAWDKNGLKSRWVEEKFIYTRGKKQPSDKGLKVTTERQLSSNLVKKYAIIIGISDYKHLPKEQNKKWHDLQYAHLDAEAFKAFLENSDLSGGNWKIDYFIEKDATTENINDALIKVFNNANRHDLIFIFFSGHGMEKNGHVFLLTYDCNPQKDTFPGYYYSILQRHIIRTRAEHVIVFIDACHSGFIGFKGEEQDSFEPRILEEYRAKIDETKVIFCSSSYGQLSWEDPKLEQGVFTNYLIKGLKGEAEEDASENDMDSNFVNLLEIARYVEEKVREHTRDNDDMELQEPRLWPSEDGIPTDDDLPVSIRKK